MNASTAATPTRGLHARVVVERDAFRLDVELDVAPGEVVAVLGPNGAGKSTLLRAVCGLTPLTKGSIALSETVLDDPEHDVFVPSAERRVGVVFQEYRLFPHLSVLDNVAFGPRSSGRSKAQSRAAATEWISRLRLDDLAGRSPERLSGGQQQRTALARALASGPGVLLLDEPLAALDAATRIDVRRDLRTHLAQFTGPTVIVTHDALDAVVLANRIVVLEHGEITQQGTALEVARRPASDYVAKLLGLNLLRGDATDGEVRVVGGGVLHVTDHAVSGPVLVALRPSAIALHTAQPQGSARNVWPGVVDGVEALGERVRVSVAGVPPVLVDVTPGAVADLHVRLGDPVWLSAKATELEIYPA
jgi:molybdate transport system ATP-binding protein